ncbi:MAG: hypothetical protein LIP05_13485 [Tannerellaceae bacterium]|nr:hypothetical protein [Tannerellaceae bacterium]
MANFFKYLFSSEKKGVESTSPQKDQKKFDIFKYDGVRAQKLGQLSYAIKCYTEALKIEEDFETMNYLSTAYTMANQIEEALDILNRMVQSEPEHINTLLSRVNIYFMLDKYTEVVHDCTQIITLDPENFLAYFSRGKAKKL